MARDDATWIMGKYDLWIENLESTSKNFSKSGKQHMRKEVRKLQRKTRAAARKLGLKQGSYMKRIKAGKAWSKGKSFGARVYSNAPHAHLVEDGHDQVQNPPKPIGRGVIPGKGIGKVIGHVDGREVFKNAYEEFEPQFEKDTDDWLEEMIYKL